MAHFQVEKHDAVSIILTVENTAETFNGVGAGVQGVQAHPQKFWYVKNVGKISEYFGKEASIFFNNSNKIIRLRYWVYRQKYIVSYYLHVLSVFII